MNSGTSIAAGVSLAHEKAGSSVKTVSLMGDSTFFHSGMQTVMDAVIKDSDQTCFILDNSWTAMTGHQMTPSTKKDLAGRKVLNALDIPGLLRAMGVKKISKADPYDLFAMKRTIIKHLGIKGFTCVVVEHECALVQAKRAGQTEQTKIKKSAISWKSTYYTIPENCQKCGICYSVLNCPAIYKNSEQKAVIDQNICVGCGMCYKICPNSAIVKFEMLE
jgi:indolepyruvate ferredoxin oxidoreductase alpha subunit